MVGDGLDSFCKSERKGNHWDIGKCVTSAAMRVTKQMVTLGNRFIAHLLFLVGTIIYETPLGIERIAESRLSITASETRATCLVPLSCLP
ncbi:hypothetical protein NPIL_271041 [Nephila pilipes]|uniref:Uncharacterized protein n=1 Tax=Nephila pilipes TaxID=299642 RepID=A0A8X6US62_NEPPI|nr:hypothetical protein NPIL_271041 [Nephila pilipes]